MYKLLVVVTITLDMMEYTVIEDDAYLVVCVNITDGTLERNVEVQLYSMDGTAEGNFLNLFLQKSNPQKRHMRLSLGLES